MIMKQWEDISHIKKLLSDGHSLILVGTSPAGINMTPGDDTKAEISFLSHLSSSLLFPGPKSFGKEKMKKTVKFFNENIPSSIFQCF